MNNTFTQELLAKFENLSTEELLKERDFFVDQIAKMIIINPEIITNVEVINDIINEREHGKN